MSGLEFIYQDYSISDNRRESEFHYTVVTDEDAFNLVERIKWPQPLRESTAIESLHKTLHIALGISYYKTFIPPKISHPYRMSNEESDFWNEVFLNGLGEFLYVNNIEPSKIAKFSGQDGDHILLDTESQLNQSALLGIGGGKDSIVAGELLKELDIDTTGFVLATGANVGITDEVSEIMDIDLRKIERTIDPFIIELNSYIGAYNGHVPISMIFALTGAVLAVNEGSRYIVVANESGASLPQAKHHDRNVNHQWSKSMEFEQLMQDYLKTVIHPELHYFSAIRPLSSVAVAKIFAHYPQYFTHFSSDNGLLKIHQDHRDHPRWSLDSTKSLSSYILLSPWLEESDLKKIFGRDFLDVEFLQDMLTDLLGHGEEAVLDCVGTPDELCSSLNELANNTEQTPKLLNYAQKHKMLENAQDIESFLSFSQHLLPQELSKQLLSVLEEKLQ